VFLLLCLCICVDVVERTRLCTRFSTTSLLHFSASPLCGWMDGWTQMTLSSPLLGWRTSASRCPGKEADVQAVRCPAALDYVETDGILAGGSVWVNSDPLCKAGGHPFHRVLEEKQKGRYFFCLLVFL
jgi:hypothetical protein